MSRRAGPCLPPTPTMRSPAIATSPEKAAWPVPSMMVPPRITMSCMGAAPACCDQTMMHLLQGVRNDVSPSCCAGSHASRATGYRRVRASDRQRQGTIVRLPLRPQQPPDHLAGRGHRHLVDEGDLARIFMRRKMRAHESLDVVGKRVRPGLSGFQHDERLDDFGAD